MVVFVFWWVYRSMIASKCIMEHHWCCQQCICLAKRSMSMQAFAFAKDLTTYCTEMYCTFLYFRILRCSSCSVFAKDGPDGCMEGVGHWLKCKNWGKYALSWALKCTSQQECQCSDDAVCKEIRCKLCCENFGLDWTHAAESDKLWEGDIVASLSVYPNVLSILIFLTLL